MTQIIFRATTATTCAAGGVITTGNVQLLPNWAPPIQYIGTTDPWHALFLTTTTMVIGGAAAKSKMLVGKVRAYGRRSSLYSGKECVATSRHTIMSNGAVRPTVHYILTYRAIGELARP